MNYKKDVEKDWIDAELEDSFDEELELEIDDHRVPKKLRHLIDKKRKKL